MKSTVPLLPESPDIFHAVRARRLVHAVAMRSLLAFVLVCFVLLCAARAEPPAANRFEKAIAAFELDDQADPPAPGGILFTGASGIRFWKTLAQDFPGLPVLNRGFGGSQLADSLHFLERVTLRYRPRTIVIQAGGNDLNAGKTPAQVLADFKTYVEKTRAVLPEVKIVLLNIGPSPKRWAQRKTQQQANRLVRDYIAAGKNLVYVDLWPDSLGADGLPKPELYVEDQLHPSAAGYALRTKLLRPHVR